jgi:uncharacterized protein with ATP-grasp and redox domains
MIDNTKCIACFHKQAIGLFEKYNVPASRRDVLFDDLNKFLISEGINYPAPFSAQYLNTVVKKETGVEDLYLGEKNYYNNLLMERYAELKAAVLNSENPLKTALRYALAGNIIDFGTPHEFDLDKTFAEALNKNLAVDNSSALFQAVSNARMVLYLGDNAGEIVTDKLFIETLQHPNIVFAVRGGPVLNDVTRQDANDVGMEQVAHVIDNGFDAPSTLTDFCSSEFMEVFERADVVISKGQGNFEGLYKQVEKDNMFFLFMVKCAEVARATGRQVGDAVISLG